MTFVDKNDDLLKDFELKFNELKSRLKIDFELNELDDIFFMKDYILHEGYVSSNPARQICSRISDGLMTWNNYLHSLMLPNPGSLINMAESRFLDEKDKKEINKIVSHSMGLISANNLAGLDNDEGRLVSFMNESIKFWKDTFKPEVKRIVGKINDNWSKK